jgi:hypothetical protein
MYLIFIIKLTGTKMNKKYKINKICLNINDRNNFLIIKVLSSGAVNEKD